MTDYKILAIHQIKADEPKWLYVKCANVIIIKLLNSFILNEKQEL